MQATQALAERFREVLWSGHWVANTNLKAQLVDLEWQQASVPLSGCNSIAALVFHLHYYISGVLEVLRGGPLSIKDQYSFDRPPLQSAADWEALQRAFFTDAEKFADSVAQLPEAKLSEAFVLAKYGSYQRNLDGMIEHCYYHLGQVVLLKKLLAAGGATAE